MPNADFSRLTAKRKWITTIASFGALFYGLYTLDGMGQRERIFCGDHDIFLSPNPLGFYVLLGSIGLGMIFVWFFSQKKS